jgi:hypothetical protein
VGAVDWIAQASDKPGNRPKKELSFFIFDPYLLEM